MNEVGEIVQHEGDNLGFMMGTDENL